jgi:hypothetical protein
MSHSENSDLAAVADALSNTAIAAQFAMLKSANGYQKFPSGLIIQWGSGTNQSPNILDVTFPMQFPSQCFIAVPIVLNNNLVSVAALNITVSGCQIYSNLSAGYLMGWVAIGW